MLAGEVGAAGAASAVFGVDESPPRPTPTTAPAMAPESAAARTMVSVFGVRLLGEVEEHVEESSTAGRPAASAARTTVATAR